MQVTSKTVSKILTRFSKTSKLQSRGLVCYLSMGKLTETRGGLGCISNSSSSQLQNQCKNTMKIAFRFETCRTNLDFKLKLSR